MTKSRGRPSVHFIVILPCRCRRRRPHSRRARTIHFLTTHYVVFSSPLPAPAASSDTTTSPSQHTPPILYRTTAHISNQPAIPNSTSSHYPCWGSCSCRRGWPERSARRGCRRRRPFPAAPPLPPRARGPARPFSCGWGVGCQCILVFRFCFGWGRVWCEQNSHKQAQDIPIQIARQILLLPTRARLVGHGGRDLSLAGRPHLLAVEFLVATDVLVRQALCLLARRGAVDAEAEGGGGGFGYVAVEGVSVCC